MALSKKKILSLKAGTVLFNSNGYIQLTTDYRPINNGFYATDMDIDDDGNLIEVNNSERLLSIYDLMRYEFWITTNYSRRKFWIKTWKI